MDNSSFGISQKQFQGIKKLPSQGATCDSYLVKLYGKLFFLKRLKAPLATDPRYVSAFKKEFETGCALEHPNLARYSNLDYDDNGIYMLIDYIEGDTLAEALEKQPEMFQDGEVLRKFISQVLDCLQYLHSKQILHLDLKPENILLTRIGGDVKIIDLGFCYSDCYSDTQGNTRDFAAPEQLISGGLADERTDIFAFGKVLEYISKHSTLPLPAKYQKIIDICIAHDKDERPRDVRKLSDMLNPKRSYFSFISFTILLLVAFFFYYFYFTNEKTEDSSSPIVTESNILPELNEVKSTEYDPDYEACIAILNQKIDSLFEVTVISKLHGVKPKSMSDIDLADLDSQYRQVALSLGKDYPQYSKLLSTEAAIRCVDLLQKLLSGQP